MKYEMNLNGKAVEQSKVINSISYHENKGVSPKMLVVKKSWKKRGPKLNTIRMDEENFLREILTSEKNGCSRVNVTKQ